MSPDTEPDEPDEPDEPERCECGAELRYVRGAGAEGWLCPSCDEEHLRELEELGALSR